MSGPTVACATCAFFDKSNAQSPVGLCRFLPPTACGIPVQRPSLAGGMQVEVQQVNMWANTRPEDWCAQHSPAQSLLLNS